MSRSIVTDITKCVACKACEFACAMVHASSDTLEEAIHEVPLPQSCVSVLASGQHSVPLQCRHCEDAPCIYVCPTLAMHRETDNGPVLINRSRCIGCRACLMACPFGAIDMSPDGKAVTKCDLCIARTKKGQKPACVESCPTHAMDVCEADAVNQSRKQRAAEQACRALDNG